MFSVGVDVELATWGDIFTSTAENGIRLGTHMRALLRALRALGLNER